VTTKYEPRRAEPGQKFDWVDGEGKTQSMRADEEGIVHVSSEAELFIADNYALPVARKALAEEKGASR
jgi:hypothetical protein